MLENIELRHLLTLRAVAEAGTFAKAAGRLGYTQSAVSQQIAVLERMVGCPLFDRPKGPKPPLLTAAGRLVVEHGREIERSVESLSRALEDMAAGRSGRLRLGTFPSISSRIVPDVVALMKQQAPDVAIELVEEDVKVSTVQRLHDGEIDICFLVSEYPGLTQQLVLEDHHVVITQAGRATESSTIPLSEVMSEPILGMPAADVCSVFLEDGLRRLGYKPSWTYRSADNSTVQSMARSGLGRGLMPMLTVDTTDTEVVFQRPDPPLPVRKVYLSRLESRTLSPAEELFWDLAVRVSSEVAQAWL